MSEVTSPPGWHGKLPSLGDFASRRLDEHFIEPWDGWLAAGLLALREADPQGWLEHYLGSPSWRFLLMPGVLPGSAGQAAWAGVLMPSVDRVGRYFPLTLVQPLGPGPGNTQQMSELWFWLGRLDDLARDALYEDWTADHLEQELARMAPPGVTAPPALGGEAPSADGMLVELSGVAAADAALHIGAEAQRTWQAGCRGRAWWYARPDETPPRLLLSRGLPAARLMSRFFGPAAPAATM
jgi:type VI secretion system protein ImpM